MSRIEDALRKAIDRGPRSRYSLCQETGIDKGQMSRFMTGASGLSIQVAERLADALELQITVGPRPQPRKNRSR